MNTFILSFDPTNFILKAEQVSVFVRENRNIIAWYYPFSGTWVFKSNASVNEISTSFRAFFSGTPFIISQVFPSNMGGAQSEDVWNWINTGAIPAPAPMLTFPS